MQIITYYKKEMIYKACAFYQMISATFTDLLDKLGEGNGNPLQYSCLENSMSRGAWQATVHGIPKSQTRLSG